MLVNTARPRIEENNIFDILLIDVEDIYLGKYPTACCEKTIIVEMLTKDVTQLKLYE